MTGERSTAGGHSGLPAGGVNVTVHEKGEPVMERSRAGRRRVRLRVLMGAAAIVVASTGCVTRPEPPGGPGNGLIGRTIAYRCPDQTGFQVAMAPDGTSVRLEGLPSGPVMLPRVRSG